jgi:hypothetical protein
MSRLKRRPTLYSRLQSYSKHSQVTTIHNDRFRISDIVLQLRTQFLMPCLGLLVSKSFSQVCSSIFSQAACSCTPAFVHIALDVSPISTFLHTCKTHYKFWCDMEDGRNLRPVAFDCERLMTRTTHITYSHKLTSDYVAFQDAIQAS